MPDSDKNFNFSIEHKKLKIEEIVKNYEAMKTTRAIRNLKIKLQLHYNEEKIRKNSNKEDYHNNDESNEFKVK